jgi:hypothetical protein|tara:strand:- start:171 stop:443 length:273 start_codon:yes stop_codon:yes gene_type:complete
LKGKDMSTKQRAHVTLKDFLRVTIAERNTIDNVTDAAAELGMTPASFKQRLLTEKKRYPELYHEWQPYLSDQRRIPTPEEAGSILDELLS